jgi:DNA-binding response OmpR family regulator
MYNMLIADADVDAWFQVNALLRRYRVKVNFVTNLGLARRCIEKEQPSLVFIDRQLLDNAAIDFLRCVKSTYRDAKIVLVNRPGENLPHLPAGADLVISKPIVPEIIESAIVYLAWPQLQHLSSSNN